VIKLQDGRWEFHEEEDQAQEKVTVKEEAKEKDQADVTGRICK
jgi:hypothetical protein